LESGDILSNQNKKFLLALLSVLVFPAGFVLFFIHKPKRDAQLFGLLALLGLIFLGFVFF